MNDNKVYAFKLVTGEEIMARIISHNDSIYILEKPVALVQAQDGLTLIPAMFIGNLDDAVELNKTAVIFKANTKDAFSDKYIEAVSGIVTSTKRIITG